MDIPLNTLAELLFASEDTSLDGQREWAARNIIDYHGSECRVVSAEFACAVREADPDSNIFYILTTGENNRTFILWRKSAWLNSRHRRMNLKVSLAVERHQRDVLAAKTEAERQHIKDCQAWLARFASQFCDISPGYKVSFLRDALFKLAGKSKYDLDALFPHLCDILEEDIVRQLWVAPPILKTHEQDEQAEAQEVQSTASASRQAPDQASATGSAHVGNCEHHRGDGLPIRNEAGEEAPTSAQEA